MDLKLLSSGSLASALEVARHYRLLNEPRNAESICLDILAVEQNHQDALITLVTDQFDGESRIKESREFLKQITDPYSASYYAGTICERAGKSVLKNNKPGARFAAYDWLRDAILRWNSRVRLITRHNPVPETAEENRPYHD